MPKRTRIWLMVVPAVFFLYFFALTDVGLLGPDEPRYASIGREMARSGDWVTPRLWGKPWFEKPALLYWMIALGNRAGLGEDLAPRLPVALLSAVFLYFYYRLLRAEFGHVAAFSASVILGTSAMWLAFGQLALTDFPMAALFALGMLCGLRWHSTGGRVWLVAAGALIGLAVLAKGLVPLVLAVPLLWLGRKRLVDFIRPAPIAAFLLAAAPWYVLCTVRYGSTFVKEFFLRHHFERFSSQTLLHDQRFWFYVPVFLAAMYPWTPALVPLFRKGFYNDPRRRFLLCWIVFGFLFFSAATNKLPGYMLPLLPAAAALAGIALGEIRGARAVLASVCLLLLIVPVVSASLPRILMMDSLRRAPLEGWNWVFAITFASLAAVIWWWEEIGRREGAVALLLFAVVFGVVYIKVLSYPMVDRLASARGVWRRMAPQASLACVDDVGRSWRYGLNYYSGVPLPDCGQSPKPLHLRQLPGHPPFLN